MSQKRFQRERDFHNKTYTEQSRSSVSKFYSIAQLSKQCYQDKLRTYGTRKRVLEYGCGTGSQAFDLAHHQAQIVGIDISDVAVELAKQTATDQGISNCINFEVMNAEQLYFPDCSFDLVCGSGILHHLDLPCSLDEVQRVLAADGHAIFYEPLGHNPFINLYRRLTPNLRTEDEHPLLVRDLRLLDRYFDCVRIRYFHLTSLLAVPFRRLPIFVPLLRKLELLDQACFHMSFLKKQAWMVVIDLSQPQKSILKG